MSVVSAGILSDFNTSLNTINLNIFQTLIYEHTDDIETLTTVNMEQPIPLKENLSLKEVNEPAESEIEDIGIKININLFGPTEPNVSHTYQDKDIDIGGRLPRTLAEVRDNLHYISATRAGKKKNLYKLNQLKQIAHKLGISSTGIKKAEIARRIIEKVNNYYNNS